MDKLDQVLKIGKIASPPFLLAGAGALGGYLFEETVIDMVHKKRWVMPVLCLRAGFGIGSFISIKQL